jgi:hypothetical protein
MYYCLICNKELIDNANRTHLAKDAKYCSQSCYHKSRFGKPSGMLGKIAWNKGKKTPENICKKLLIIRTGKKASQSTRKKMSEIAIMKGFGKWMIGKTVPEVTREKISRNNARIWKGKIPPCSIGQKGMPKLNQRGDKHWNWQGGLTSNNEKIRKSLEYKIWRRAVYERDNYTCVMCNERGGKLQADHIKPFSLYPELRLAIDNGRTVCGDCHKKTDTYGHRVHRFKFLVNDKIDALTGKE